tara:strand:- start:77 stop:820 length:744 start_codon:yes stop_codon:yes gene_type:complete
MSYIISLLFFSFTYTLDEFYVTIPATSYYDWVYFSIENNSVVDIDDPQNSSGWDLAFQRKHIRTNGGMSGSGNGGAYVDSSKVWSSEWGSINEIPDSVDWVEDKEMYDFYDLQTHTFVKGIKNPALNAWGWFNESYQLIPTNYVMLAKCANGIDVVKIWAYDYYQNGAGGNISIRYQTGLVLDYDCSNIAGDVNNDEIVNIVDIVTMVSFVLGSSTLSECQLMASDINQDQIVNVVDIVAIVSMILD